MHVYAIGFVLAYFATRCHCRFQVRSGLDCEQGEAQTVHANGVSARPLPAAETSRPRQPVETLATLLLSLKQSSPFQKIQQARRLATSRNFKKAWMNVKDIPMTKDPVNVMGTDLQCCCSDVHGSGIGTGFYRDGFCNTGPEDQGLHTVCIQATQEFLAVSAAVGNPLHQAMPQYSFPGVRVGDFWCLCAKRYAQLLELEEKGAVRDEKGNKLTGFVPRIRLLATHEKVLDHVPLDTLFKYAIDVDEANADKERLEKMRSQLGKQLGL